MKPIKESIDGVFKAIIDRVGIKEIPEKEVIDLIIKSREKSISALIPPRYLRHIRQAIQDRDILIESLFRGDIVSILGPVGSGKTSLAAAIAFQAASAGVTINKAPNISFDFFNATGLIFELQGGYSNGSTSDVRNNIKSKKLVLIDDIFAGETTSAIHRELLYLIDYRYGAKLATIITSNLSLSEIAQIDARIASRIVEGYTVKLNGKDRRLHNDN
jgi:DNA replication protein DnaC